MINKLMLAIVLTLMYGTLNAQNPINKSDFLIMDDGTGLFVKKSGTGPICIFIHGGPGAWSESFEKLKGSKLESNLSMVYYDQRGSGRSGKSVSDDYSMERMIEDIDLIRQHYNAEKVYLLAHSFGGILAVNYALKYPKHVEGLILANSTLSLSSSLKNQIAYMNGLLNTNFIPIDDSPTTIMATFLEAKKALSAKELTYKTLSDNKANVDMLEEIDNRNPSEYHFAQSAFKIVDYWKDYTKISGKIEVPVLIITGKKDHSVGKDHYLSFHFKNQKIKKINGGHLLYYENNKEFIKSIFRFIK